MAALWQRSLRGERGRGRDSVHSAIPYGLYQFTSARARSRRLDGQLIQRYGIAVSGCSVAAVDESALENVTRQAGPAAASRWRSTSTAAARPDLSVDVWPLPKPRSVSRKSDLPLTMVATSSCGPDARRATWQCGHRTSPRSASRGPAARMDRAGRRFGRAGGAGAIRWSPSALACGGADRTIHARRVRAGTNVAADRHRVQVALTVWPHRRVATPNPAA